jgi:prepilin-type N-terminal cleavage/methylation domain-containing protein/prepilin-type processing-associated H-X9-DG protein
MSRKNGFTLIELLVVISIIAMLLSIMMPALGRAKLIAENVICKAGLHQYALAGHIFLNDSDEKFPNPWMSLYDSCQGRCKGVCTKSYHETLPGEAQRYCRWHNEKYDLNVIGDEFGGPLWEYLDAKDAHLCPTFKRISKDYGSLHDYHRSEIEIVPQFGYCQNAYLGSEQFEGGVLRLSQVNRPGNTFFFAEENPFEINLVDGYDEDLSSASLNDTSLVARKNPNDPRGFDDCFATFHNASSSDPTTGTGNAAFLDGSVSEVKAHGKATFMYAWPNSNPVQSISP